MGQDESRANAGALLLGNGYGDGEDSSTANLDWAALGTIGEEVVNYERGANEAQLDDR